MKNIDIYTDGACSGNPGPGGYGAVLLDNGARKELSGGYKTTTNNRMEIIAAIRGLSALRERCAVRLFSDSRYLVDAVQKGWAVKWRSNGWKRNRTDKALNVDLWTELLELLERHDVDFVWVKGHADNAENERCDRLARDFITNGELPDDIGYNGGKDE